MLYLILQGELSNANRQFAFDLFDQVNLQNENFVISPLSLSIILGIISNGASGTTYEEVIETAHYENSSLSELNMSYKALLNTLQSLEPGLQLSLAHSLWIKDNYPIYDDFVQSIKAYYNAEAYNAPFDQTTVTQINQWVNENTNGMITNLINNIYDEDVMYALNTISFIGDWKFAFDETNTVEEIFYNYDNTLSPVPFMYLPVETFQYYIGDSFIASRLPYTGDDISLYIFRPNDYADFDEFINEFTLENITQWLDSFDYLTDEQLGEYPTNIMIPKFSLEYKIKLNAVLQALRINRAFDFDADFSNMTSQNPWIRFIMQKAFIELTEEGTSAAAATSVCWSESLGFRFVVNRPFVFMIYDDRTESILFIGKILSL